MTSPTSGPLVRVLVVYQHLPHYRGEVFAELESSDRVRWTFAADLDSRDGTIPTIPPARLREFHRLRNRWFGPALWQSGLLGLLVRQRFDAVVFLGDVAYVSTWVASAVARARGSKVLFWTIGWHRPERGVRRWVRLCFYRLSHALLLYGIEGERLGIALGYPPERLNVIGNSTSSHPVSAERLTDAQPSVTTSLPSPGSDVVTAVVRLMAPKGLDLLIRAAAELTANGRPVTVLLVGTGPEEGMLRELAVSLRVDARFLGAVYSPEVLQTVYERTSVTVVPLRAGLTCTQSLHYGVPVITTDDPYKRMPESDAIRPGVTGGLYVDGSVHSLASTIDVWLDRMRADRATIAEHCQIEAERWTPAAHAAAISAVVAAVLDEAQVAA